MGKVKTAKQQKQEVRFQVNKDNTVLDRKTGLVIIQDPTLLGDDFKRVLTWDDANKAVAELNAKGYSGFKDWRLPTVEEICGMIDRTKYDPCYDTAIFKGKFDDWYWTSETCVWNNGAAWVVCSGSGYVDGDGEGYRRCVRPVRSSQSLRFDNLTAKEDDSTGEFESKEIEE